MTYPYDGDATVGMIASAFLPAAGDARRIEPIDAVLEALLDSIANLKEGDPVFEGAPRFEEAPIFENGAWFKAGLFLFDTDAELVISTVDASVAASGELHVFGAVMIEDDAFLTVKDGGIARVNGGGTLFLNSDGRIVLNDNSSLIELKSASTLKLNASATLDSFGTILVENESDLIVNPGANFELHGPMLRSDEGRDVLGRQDTTPGTVSGIYTYGADDKDIIKVASAPNTEVIQIVLKNDARQLDGDLIYITNVGHSGGGATIDVYGNGLSATTGGIVIGTWTTDQKKSLLARYSGNRWHALLWTDGMTNIS